MCRNSLFFAAFPEIELHERRTGPAKSPDWRGIDESVNAGRYDDKIQDYILLEAK
jgi:hypothetical protein